MFCLGSSLGFILFSFSELLLRLSLLSGSLQLFPLLFKQCSFCICLFLLSRFFIILSLGFCFTKSLLGSSNIGLVKFGFKNFLGSNLGIELTRLRYGGLRL